MRKAAQVRVSSAEFAGNPLRLAHSLVRFLRAAVRVSRATGRVAFEVSRVLAAAGRASCWCVSHRLICDTDDRCGGTRRSSDETFGQCGGTGDPGGDTNELFSGTTAFTADPRDPCGGTREPIGCTGDSGSGTRERKSCVVRSNHGYVTPLRWYDSALRRYNASVRRYTSSRPCFTTSRCCFTTSRCCVTASRCCFTGSQRWYATIRYAASSTRCSVTLDVRTAESPALASTAFARPIISSSVATACCNSASRMRRFADTT